AHAAEHLRGVIANDANRDLIARDEFFEQHPLLVVPPEGDHGRADFFQSIDEGLGPDPLARSFPDRFRDQRQLESDLGHHAREFGVIAVVAVRRWRDHDAHWHTDIRVLHNPPAHVFVQADGQRQYVGPGVWDAEHLTDGRNAGLAVARS